MSVEGLAGGARGGRCVWVPVALRCHHAGVPKLALRDVHGTGPCPCGLWVWPADSQWAPHLLPSWAHSLGQRQHSTQEIRKTENRQIAGNRTGLGDNKSTTMCHGHPALPMRGVIITSCTCVIIKINKSWPWWTWETLGSRLGHLPPLCDAIPGAPTF